MPLVDYTDSVLVVVDTQPGFVDYEDMPEATREASARTVDRIAWLAGFAGMLGVPVVVVEEDPSQNGPTHERVASRLPAGTPVETKDAFSLSACPAAVDAIRATGRNTLVVVGYETDVCVAQSAIELHDLGFRVVAPADLSCSGSADEHRRGLERMLHAGIEPSSFKGLAFEWMRTVARAEELWARAEDALGIAPFPRRDPSYQD
ncbi:MAG TPA: isochorismatase family protein [Thermoleophilaceae bacterium]